MKDDSLQRIYFKNKYERAWREELREHIKWNVDRSSPSNKLRNFIDWLPEVALDLRYQRRINSFPLLLFLTSTWYSLLLIRSTSTCYPLLDCFHLLIIVNWFIIIY